MSCLAVRLAEVLVELLRRSASGIDGRMIARDCNLQLFSKRVHKVFPALCDPASVQATTHCLRAGGAAKESGRGGRCGGKFFPKKC